MIESMNLVLQLIFVAFIAYIVVVWAALAVFDAATSGGNDSKAAPAHIPKGESP